ncbi:MAG: dihydrofolate reductase family protein [Sandaracinaceae bacterium]|nr:deaminase [Myxococcales bacterium]
MPQRVRAYIACSLDGFIAGPGDDLSWLPQPSGESDTSAFDAFLEQIGALLMGRRTHDVVASFDVAWPYGERAVLVATHRPLEPAHGTVRAVEGSIEALVEEAKRVAEDQDVYVDGGALIRQALDADLLDEMIVTVVPYVLGEGHPLFAGAQRRPLELIAHEHIGEGMMQMTYRPAGE